ncbi:hypothetical protein D9M73_282440 [compost metagenome]
MPSSGHSLRLEYMARVMQVQAPRDDSSSWNGGGPLSAPPRAAGSSASQRCVAELKVTW